ncbi:MAG: TIGR03986 family CRISPR-associated RAMP protein [Lachnospiraceae bacterium]|nr:TIGR03986 family CRISPR-associated RAMP protein [Lachnospiraceae bacterium]
MYKFINPYNFIPMGTQKAKASKKDTDELVSGMITYSVWTKTPLFIPNTSYNKVYQDKQAHEDHKSYQFYSYVNYQEQGSIEKIPYPKPVIPGSEIRGMFRSNYEILTNSCMSALDSDKKLSKRTMESYQPGLLQRVAKRDGSVRYDLVKATDVLWRTMGANNAKEDLVWGNDKEHYDRNCYIQEKFPEGSRVEFILHIRYNDQGRRIKPVASSVRMYGQEDRNQAQDQKVAGRRQEGYIIKGEKGPDMPYRLRRGIPPSRKRCCRIFQKDERPGNVWEDVKISLLDELLEVYAKNDLDNASRYEEYKERYEEFKSGNGNEYFPVYYSIIVEGANQRIANNQNRNMANNRNQKKRIFLAPACKTREIYDHTLSHLAGNLAPCTAGSGYCEACELFGAVTADGEAKSSHLRFTDLQAEEKEDSAQYYLPRPITLPELSSPKLNNMEFYLERPKGQGQNAAWFWTYDYYIDAGGNLHIQQGRLAGRKFYWHQDLGDDYCPQEEKGKRNVTIHPVRSKIAFEGKIYFDKISKETLNKLIYLINAGEQPTEMEKKEHGYKIGMAKPLGLGSIASQVNEVKIKSYVIEDGIAKMQELPYESYDIQESREGFVLAGGSALLNNFGKMTSFQGAGKGEDEYFSYPKVDEDSLGYEWFTKNHVGVKPRNREEEVGMPNARKEMKFKKYLQAMEPRVKNV